MEGWGKNKRDEGPEIVLVLVVVVVLGNSYSSPITYHLLPITSPQAFSLDLCTLGCIV